MISGLRSGGLGLEGQMGEGMGIWEGIGRCWRGRGAEGGGSAWWGSGGLEGLVVDVRYEPWIML